ncbi:MAG TPA: M23 family metallopeptidase [Epsilonproteobacteria bacterium]|nr:M23 family metallopeptidase [Campylobacterota bacterium]
MPLRRGFFLLFLFVALYAAKYPETFASLSTPLYKAAKSLERLSFEAQLAEPIKKYENDAKQLRAKGLALDNSTDKEKKLAYLRSLRKLQKEYDYIIYLLHHNIQKSIQENDYATFEKLTAFELPTLLAPRALREQAVKYYKKQRHKGKIKLLESIIKEKELLEVTSQEFFNQTESSQLSSHATAQQSHKDVYATTKKGRNFVAIFFTNTNIYDVTVEVKGNYTNIEEKRFKENVFVIKAHSRVKYAKLSFKASGARYSIAYRWIIGSKDAKHKREYLYRLPYARGESHMVSQGFNGKSTHKGHSQYAVDFKMDVGTKVYAARGGIVVKTKEDSNKHGFAKEFAKYGNYVTVLHSDGTFGTYYHLKKGGVLVNVGQRVERGEPLGYSGNTGYTSGPHLHFAVFKAMSTLKTKSLPIRFISSAGIIKDPKVGTYYKAK